jgi:hypothetical protein
MNLFVGQYLNHWALGNLETVLQHSPLNATYEDAILSVGRNMWNLKKRHQELDQQQILINQLLFEQVVVFAQILIE